MWNKNNVCIANGEYFNLITNYDASQIVRYILIFDETIVSDVNRFPKYSHLEWIFINHQILWIIIVDARR